MNFLKNEPAVAGALAALIGAVVGVFVDNPALAASLGGVFLAFVGVRQVVTPVTKAAEQVTVAATTAATEVAKNLGHDTVGVVGEVTEDGKEIIRDTVGQAVKGIFG